MSAPTAEVTASSSPQSASTDTGSDASAAAAQAKQVVLATAIPRPPVVRATPEEIAAQAAAVEAWKLKPDAPARALLVE